MSDMKKLLEAMDSMAKAEKKPTGPKFPGYWKGTDPASQAKNKMVGGSAQESIIKELNKTAKETSMERKLKEEFSTFNDVNEGVVGRAIAKGKDWLDRLDGNPNPSNLINQQRREKQEQRKKQSQQRQQGVAENQLVVKKENPLDLSSDYAYYIAGKGNQLLATFKKLFAKADAMAPKKREYFYSNLQDAADEGNLGDVILHYSKTLNVDDLLAISDVFEEYGQAFHEIAYPDDFSDFEQAWKQYASDVALTRTQQQPGQTVHEQSVAEGTDGVDTVSVDVPLLIRLLEYAREDAKTDMDLHDVAERLIKLSQEGRTLTMHDYDNICPTQQVDEVAPVPPTAPGGNAQDPNNQATNADKQATVNTQKNLSKLKMADPTLNPGLANQALQGIEANPNKAVSGAQLQQTQNLADLVGDALADPQKGSQLATILQQVQQSKRTQ